MMGGCRKPFFKRPMTIKPILTTFVSMRSRRMMNSYIPSSPRSSHYHLCSWTTSFPWRDSFFTTYQLRLGGRIGRVLFTSSMLPTIICSGVFLMMISFSRVLWKDETKHSITIFRMSFVLWFQSANVTDHPSPLPSPVPNRPTLTCTPSNHNTLKTLNPKLLQMHHIALALNHLMQLKAEPIVWTPPNNFGITKEPKYWRHADPLGRLSL